MPVLEAMPDLLMAYGRDGLETVVYAGTLGAIQYFRTDRWGEEIAYVPPFRWILGVTTPACRMVHVHGKHCAGGSYDRAYLACPYLASSAAQKEGTQVIFTLQTESHPWIGRYPQEFAINVVCADFFAGDACTCCSSCNLSAEAVAGIKSAAGDDPAGSEAQVPCVSCGSHRECLSFCRLPSASSAVLASVTAELPPLCRYRQDYPPNPLIPSVTCARCQKGPRIKVSLFQKERLRSLDAAAVKPEELCADTPLHKKQKV